MEKRLTWLAIGAAVIGMGIAMPSCPGQQAMQQQIDDLTKSNTDLKQQVGTMETQVRNMNADLVQTKTLVQNMGNAVLVQKDAIDKLDASVKEQAAVLSSMRKPQRKALKKYPAKVRRTH